MEAIDHHNKENVDPKALLALEGVSLHPTYPPTHCNLTTSAPSSVSPEFALAFDIDGVLVRGKVAIPCGKAALELLKEKNVPFIMLTNGGGHHEEIHSARVSERVGTMIEEDQFVQSHTPFKLVINDYKDQWVLVLGGSKDQIKDLAAAYGLNPDMILTTSDVQKHHPLINPFPEVTLAHHAQYGQIRDGFTDADRIAALFVFSCPRDWCLDLQICLDLLLSEQGVLGTRSQRNGRPDLPNCGYQQDGQPTIYFCNPDFEWATQYPLPRVAQGAFRAALEGLWRGATEGKAGALRAWTCGKPTAVTYRYAEAALEAHYYKKMGVIDPGARLRRVYMIGDNPKSDICGARMADRESHLTWRSVLVETGVHEAGSVPEHEPTVIKENVLEAVKWVLEQEMGNKMDG